MTPDERLRLADDGALRLEEERDRARSEHDAALATATALRLELERLRGEYDRLILDYAAAIAERKSRAVYYAEGW